MVVCCVVFAGAAFFAVAVFFAGSVAFSAYGLVPLDWRHDVGGSMLPAAQLHHLPQHAVALYAEARRLNRLGYLPCRPSLVRDQAERLDVSCQWRGAIPPGLHAVAATVLIRGAFTAWKHATAYGLAPADGVAPYAYTWVSVNKDNPAETMTIWQFNRSSGTWHAALHTLVNTGTDHTTQDGSWPIYWRLRTTQMRGITPSGTYYDYRTVPWVNYYHGNDAIHGFSRAMYGFPQSTGCVELPVRVARLAYGLLHYGTVVTVSGRWRRSAGYSPSVGAETAAPAKRPSSP